MFSSCHGSPGDRCRAGPRRAAWQPAAASAALLLGGCGAASTPPWGFASLALLATAFGGYAVGSLHTRLAGGRALRSARAAERDLTALHGWLWRTDAAHRLLSWQGPGQPPQPRCVLFADPGLLDRLATEQGFAGLRIRATEPHDGSLGWELSALPRHDDHGRFDGFVGCARPTDTRDRNAASAAALAPLLASHAGPALLLHDHGNGWELLQHNAAAAALWPQLDAGSALPEFAEQLPPAVAAALQAQQRTAQADGAAPQRRAHDRPAQPPLLADGWQLRPFALPRGARGVVLVQAADVAGGANGASENESESFGFTVSHDLRAPIRVVEGFTRIVKEDYGRLLDRVANDHLDRVLGAAARMNLMIDALLTLARLSSQPLARQPVNLSQLAGFVVDDLRRSAPERDAEVDIEPGLTAMGDPTLLRLVLENLLGNAWKYSARVARAQISLRAAPSDARRDAVGGARSAFVVRDNGAGFDMQSADRLFGLFQRLHSASEFAGHGVGLASVRRIVRRHGGEIWAEAEAGRGAAFFFTLA